MDNNIFEKIDLKNMGKYSCGKKIKNGNDEKFLQNLYGSAGGKIMSMLVYEKCGNVYSSVNKNYSRLMYELGEIKKKQSRAIVSAMSAKIINFVDENQQALSLQYINEIEIVDSTIDLLLEIENYQIVDNMKVQIELKKHNEIMIIDMLNNILIDDKKIVDALLLIKNS